MQLPLAAFSAGVDVANRKSAFPLESTTTLPMSVLQAEFCAAVGSVMPLLHVLDWPPSVETQRNTFWLARPWYAVYTTAAEVGWPLGSHVASHCRSVSADTGCVWLKVFALSVDLNV